MCPWLDLPYLKRPQNILFQIRKTHFIKISFKLWEKNMNYKGKYLKVFFFVFCFVEASWYTTIMILSNTVLTKKKKKHYLFLRGNWEKKKTKNLFTWPKNTLVFYDQNGIKFDIKMIQIFVLNLNLRKKETKHNILILYVIYSG